VAPSGLRKDPDCPSPQASTRELPPLEAIPQTAGHVAGAPGRGATREELPPEALAFRYAMDFDNSLNTAVNSQA